MQQLKVEPVQRSAFYGFGISAFWFTLYSFMGWAFEMCLVLVRTGNWAERGFLHLPLCPIYGFGALLVMTMFKHVRPNIGLIFVISAGVLTLLEYLTSWYMETAFQHRWWDYSDWLFHLNGRISLWSSIGFGLASVLVLKWVHPCVKARMERRFSDVAMMQTGLIVAMVIFADFCITAYIRMLRR